MLRVRERMAHTSALQDLYATIEYQRYEDALDRMFSRDQGTEEGAAP